MDEVVDKEKIEIKIAELIKQRGGQLFYVGGYVRDKYLNRENKDIDVEAHGIDYDELIDIVSFFGHPLVYGSSFGIVSLNNYNIDIGLPRKELNTGKGHRDFEIYTDPFIGTYAASKRRDFTMNAIMQDVLTGEIVDHFYGIKDIENRIIRHIDDASFVEDPLRVLRACQFAARFEFDIAPETLSLCSKIDLSSLSKERVEEELKKALLNANKPSIFFYTLKQMNQLSYWFKEIEQLIDLKQDPIYHPEGDVFIHTMQVLDEASKYRDKVSDPYNFMLLALCHDLGKISASFKDGDRIHAYNHEHVGVEFIDTLLHRFTNNKDVIKYVKNMSELHMKPNVIYRQNSSVKASNTMFDKAIAPVDLIYFAKCDHVNNNEIDEREKFLFERLDIYNKIINEPHVTGEDLIEAGLKPDEYFSKVLDYAHKLHLSGVDKRNALTQSLAYYIEISK